MLMAVFCHLWWSISIPLISFTFEDYKMQIQSWKMLHKLNRIIPFKTVYFLGVRELTTLSYTVYYSHSVRRRSFPIHFNIIKIISLSEPAKPTCTCTKWFNIIIMLWQILTNRMSLGLNQKHAYRQCGLNSDPLSKYSNIIPTRSTVKLLQ